MGLAILVVGLIVFLGAHSFVVARDARARAIRRYGKLYWMLFGLAATIGVALMAWGFSLYRRTGWIDLWYPPQGMRHITVGLMLIAVVLVLAAYLPGHIRTWTRQPLLAAIKLWAFAHLLSNGDLGSILLFGSFLAWGIFARISVKRRAAAGEVLSVRTDGGWRNDVLAVLLGILIFLALGYTFHPIVIGVPVFGA